MHETAAFTGHASLSEMQRYTKADQTRLAQQQWIRPNSEHLLSSLSQSGLTIWPEKISKSKCELKDGAQERTVSPEEVKHIYQRVRPLQLSPCVPPL
jgi:hypothetical protein